MQLHLMLKIFVSDAWLASWILFENFCSKIFWMTLQNVYNMLHTFYLVNQPYKKYSLFVSSKSVANRDCWSRVVVIGYWTDNLKAENYSAIHFLGKWFVFELWFSSRIVGVPLYMAMTSSQMECVISKNWSFLLRNIIVGISGYKLPSTR